MNFLTNLHSKFANQSKGVKTLSAMAISILALFLLNRIDQSNEFFDTAFMIVVILNIILNLNIYFERKR